MSAPEETGCKGLLRVVDVKFIFGSVTLRRASLSPKTVVLFPAPLAPPPTSASSLLFIKSLSMLHECLSLIGDGTSINSMNE